MHIKHLTIEGFRSFRSQQALSSVAEEEGEDEEGEEGGAEEQCFHPGHNVVVGRNGSGKSNLFLAIEFVLMGSSKYSRLSQEERQAILHEGAGRAASSAMVEICLDNAEQRLPVPTDEVVIRRQIGLKKDEFFLNGKRVRNREEISSLLETAGFSKSNPYYIVRQGKIDALSLMTDKERLDLLKEVAGTTVYEKRRAESVGILEQANAEREQVRELVDEINTRLQELESEKEELVSYQRVESTRRAVENVLLEKEVRKIREQLEGLEQTREAISSQRSETENHLRALQDSIADRMRSKTALAAQQDRLQREATHKAGAQEELAKQRAEIEAALAELQDAERVAAEALETKRAEVGDLDRQIEEAHTQLEQDISPQLAAAKAAAGRLEADIAQVDRRVEALTANRTFESQAERDEHLQKQISLLQEREAHHADMLSTNQEEHDREAARVQALQTTQREMVRKQGKRRERLAGLRRKFEESSREATDVLDQRRELQRKRDDLVQGRQDAMADLEAAKATLDKNVPYHILRGLEELESIVADLGITEGYYGALVDNISLQDPQFAIAVERAAGNGLFNVLVDNDEIASQLIAELHRRRGGRVSIMPLANLKVRPLQYPQSPDIKVIMNDALLFDERIRPAVQEVFGKKLLARDLEVASQFARSAKMDAITLDGDIVTRKAAVEGGFHDDRRAVLPAVSQMHEARKILAETEEHEHGLEAELQAADARYNRLRTEVNKLEFTMNTVTTEMEQQEAEQSSELEELRQARDRVRELSEDILPSVQRAYDQAVQALEASQAELAKPWSNELSHAEETELRDLRVQQTTLREEQDAAERALRESELKEQKLRAVLNDDLLKRKTELLEQIGDGVDSGASSVSAEDASAELEKVTLERELLVKEMEAQAEELRELTTKQQDVDQGVQDIEAELEELRAEEATVIDQLDEEEKQQEKLYSKRAALVQQREQRVLSLQDIGSLDTQVLEEVGDLSERELRDRLKTARRELKKYDHVNKKARDQYMTFSDRRDDLLGRMTELDEGDEKINDLIQALDLQKDEAILRTFTGVAEHFSSVFSELVQGGTGRLVMLTAADTNDDDSDSDADVDSSGMPNDSVEPGTAMDGMSVASFRGVQPRVSFGSSSEQCVMAQLSGGQRALVALALMFAIQRCDPAPFYLFDEMDQALDQTYRAGLAALIRRQADSEDNPAQIITTTFRPELVQVAHRCFGISHQHKKSSLHLMQKSEALEFVASLQREEAVGQVTTRPGVTSPGERASSASASRKRGRERSSKDKGRNHLSSSKLTGSDDVEDDNEDEDEDEEDEDEDGDENDEQEYHESEDTAAERKARAGQRGTTGRGGTTRRSGTRRAASQRQGRF